MDEAAAKNWMAELDVSRETHDRIEEFVTLLRVENGKQNLVGSASLDHVFARHIVDSAQLWQFAPEASSWLDLGSGAGLPGLIIAMLTAAPVTLVESRRLRSEWLARAANALGLSNVHVEPARLELVDTRPAGVITARAFAPLPKLFSLAHRFSTEDTLWILPKGRSAPEELASIASTWHGSFHMEPSVTDPESAILIARDVKPRGRRR